jgi:hypothetical protein
MKKCLAVAFAFSVLAVLGAGTLAAQNRRVIHADLIGYSEVPSVSSTGEGEFQATWDDSALEFRLTYSGLEGNVTQAHIHFAQKDVNGGITVFLCSNLDNGPVGTPPCPQSGEVTGVRMAGDMTGGAEAQGIAAGEFAELLEAIQAGKTYANVHTEKHGGGELRGQLRIIRGNGGNNQGNGDDEGDDD